jgi:ATP synthase protein I
MLKVLMGQAVIGLAVALACWSLGGNVAGYSALLGSLACVIPNGFLALRLALPRRDPGAKALLRAAWIGEIGKLALTVLFISLVLATVRPLAGGPFFAGFIASQFATLLGFVLRSPNETVTETSVSNGE